MEIPMTQEGYNRLAEELDHLKTVDRPQNMAELKHARSYGDFRENAEYDYAKQQQSLIEARIRELESQLSIAKIVEQIDSSKIGIGTRVKVYDIEYDEDMEYALVNEGVAAPAGLDAVSPLSPIGQALLDKRIGEEVNVPVPAGVLRLKVLEINPL